ncbi:hypothetical protein OQJ15_02055 [Fluoribacter dumoffii]|uniref:hypothetical protein n=1 Tax=Fluoribacter dumoffii TaxID=463 RepID=UPI002242E400|nr:hypothetical protein [Fluoribacter dumoffii]MCW8385082.1 hypothetical protein [Fluoribacter dumoffii]MCW8496620.1 hypothetical protein [Fluoribacter dumoffii]
MDGEIGNPSENNSFEYIINDSGEERKEVASWQLVQAVYHSITGKTEKITIENEHACQLNLNKIRQLHYKIQQSSEAYEVVTSNCSVTVFHQNDIKQVFSSFEKFEHYDSSNNNAIKRIQLKYNVLIHPPKVNNPQNYTIVVNLLSGIIIEQEIANISKRLSASLAPLIDYDTIKADINYVDYVIANNYQHTIKEWMNSVSDNKKRILVNLLKPIMLTLKYLMLFLLFWGFLLISSKFSLHNPFVFYKYLIVTSVCLILAFQFGEYVSYKIGKLILQKPLSYIHLNEGDKKAIEIESKRRNRMIFQGVILPLIQIILGIIPFFLK